MTKNPYRVHVVHNEYDKVAQIQVACGGVNVGNGSNCISWQKGQTEWKEYALTHHMRAMGQAATMADGSILLLGGQVDPNCMGKSARAEGNCTGWATDQTVERVTPGKSEVVFSIKHGDNKNGCAVQPVPGGEVVLLGGGACFFCRGSPHAHVERYDQTGHLGSLPDLLTPRWENKPNTLLLLTKKVRACLWLFLRPHWQAGAPGGRGQHGPKMEASGSGSTNSHYPTPRICDSVLLHPFPKCPCHCLTKPCVPCPTTYMT